MTQADTDRHKQQQTQTCWKCLWSCSWAPTHTHKHTHTPTHKTGAARCRCWARLGKAAGEIEHASLCNQRRAETKRLQYCFSDARSRHSHTHISKLTDKSRLLLMHSQRKAEAPQAWSSLPTPPATNTKTEGCPSIRVVLALCLHPQIPTTYN